MCREFEQPASVAVRKTLIRSFFYPLGNTCAVVVVAYLYKKCWGRNCYFRVTSLLTPSPCAAHAAHPSLNKGQGNKSPRRTFIGGPASRKRRDDVLHLNFQDFLFTTHSKAIEPTRKSSRNFLASLMDYAICAGVGTPGLRPTAPLF